MTTNTAASAAPAPTGSREAELQALLGPERVILGQDIAPALRSDFMGQDIGSAEAYFKVQSTEEVQKLVRYAADHDLHVGGAEEEVAAALGH